MRRRTGDSWVQKNVSMKRETTAPVHASPVNVHVSAAVQLKLVGPPSYPARHVKLPVQLPSGTVSHFVTYKACRF